MQHSRGTVCLTYGIVKRAFCSTVPSAVAEYKHSAQPWTVALSIKPSYHSTTTARNDNYVSGGRRREFSNYIKPVSKPFFRTDVRPRTSLDICQIFQSASVSFSTCRVIRKDHEKPLSAFALRYRSDPEFRQKCLDRSRERYWNGGYREVKSELHQRKKAVDPNYSKKYRDWTAQWHRRKSKDPDWVEARRARQKALLAKHREDLDWVEAHRAKLRAKYREDPEWRERQKARQREYERRQKLKKLLGVTPSDTARTAHTASPSEDHTHASLASLSPETRDDPVTDASHDVSLDKPSPNPNSQDSTKSTYPKRSGPSSTLRHFSTIRGGPHPSKVLQPSKVSYTISWQSHTNFRAFSSLRSLHDKLRGGEDDPSPAGVQGDSSEKIEFPACSQTQLSQRSSANRREDATSTAEDQARRNEADQPHSDELSAEAVKRAEFLARRRKWDQARRAKIFADPVRQAEYRARARKYEQAYVARTSADPVRRAEHLARQKQREEDPVWRIRRAAIEKRYRERRKVRLSADPLEKAKYVADKRHDAQTYRERVMADPVRHAESLERERLSYQSHRNKIIERTRESRAKRDPAPPRSESEKQEMKAHIHYRMETDSAYAVFVKARVKRREMARWEKHREHWPTHTPEYTREKTVRCCAGCGVRTARRLWWKRRTADDLYDCIECFTVQDSGIPVPEGRWRKSRTYGPNKSST